MSVTPCPSGSRLMGEAIESLCAEVSQVQTLFDIAMYCVWVCVPVCGFMKACSNFTPVLAIAWCLLPPCGQLSFYNLVSVTLLELA